MQPHNNPGQRRSVIVLLTLLLTLSVFSLNNGPAAAQTVRRSFGEMIAARNATINNRSAVSGQAIIDGSRISTGKGGALILSMGRNGRLELGAETAFTATVAKTASASSGNLASGRMKISAPAGVSLIINTPKGIVITDPRQSSLVSVTATSDSLRVTTLVGESSIQSGTRTERVVAGEEFTVAGSNWSRRVASREMLAASITLSSTQDPATLAGGSGFVAGTLSTAAAGIPSSTVQGAVTTGNILGLFNTSLGISRALSIQPGSDRPTDVERFFDTTLICRDMDSPICRRRIIPTSGIFP